MNHPPTSKLIHCGLVSIVVASALTGTANADTNCAAFRKEQRIEAKKDGAWAKSTVVRCDPRKGFLVHFDGFSSANDAWLAAADMRALAVATPPPPPASVAGLQSNDYVYIQRPNDPKPFVGRLWHAGPTIWSYMADSGEMRIDPADIKGKWDPATMKYKVGQKVRYVAGGFYPATIKAVEAGGYRADISGGVTNTNVLVESNFVDDWRYEEFEQAIAPVRQLAAMKLEWLSRFDAGTQSSLQPPHETAVDSVPEFEKVVAAYELANRTLVEKFQDLPPLVRPDCQFCPRRLADVIARHKKILERAVPLDPSSAVKEFLRNMEPSESWYVNDFRPCPECDVLSAKDPKKKAQELLAKRIGKQIAYAKALGIPPRTDIPMLEASIDGFIKKWDAMVRKKAPMLDSFAKEGASFSGRDAKLVGPAKNYLRGYPTTTCKLLGAEKHDWRAHGTGTEHVGRYKYVGFDCTDPQYRYPLIIAVAVEQAYLGFGKYDSATRATWDLQSYYRR